MSKSDQALVSIPPERRTQSDGKYYTHDVAYPGMPLRQYDAIKLGVPDSGDKWLDEMIVKSQLNEFAGQVMASGRF